MVFADLDGDASVTPGACRKRENVLKAARPDFSNDETTRPEAPLGVLWRVG